MKSFTVLNFFIDFLIKIIVFGISNAMVDQIFKFFTAAHKQFKASAKKVGHQLKELPLIVISMNVKNNYQ